MYRDLGTELSALTLQIDLRHQILERTMAAAALLEENKKLREELARLEALERAIAEDKKREKDQNKSVEKVRKAFEHFDKDKSGFIDRNELQLLADELGETLDDAELEAAMKEIDVSGDGKISFEEFYRWWTRTARLHARASSRWRS